MIEQTFSTAFERVKELVENFQAGEQNYLESKYSEAQARLDFIDKFWMALGWDVNHERERNPYQQEVKVERGVAVSNRLKKADYAFFAAPNFRDVKFYVEAKKPSRNLDNADDYFQTIRYGWSSNTPLAVLTDFEQFRVIDCRYKPNIKTAENFALLKFDYREYADEAKFREIYHLFSRGAVISGALEEYAGSLPKRGKGKQRIPAPIQKSVDESFLDDLDSYRETLARAFKNKNAELDGEDLTEAVTRTIDRLVFIRFLEDKLIEPETMMDKFDSWADFVRASSRLNSFYNGIIFKPHFIDSPDFKPDDKVFADICGELSDKNTPYNFNYIPVHILGSIYERFLGKVIVATDKRAHVEEKPEVRKAGGVYYTPEYIVRYIVENTIGKLIENKTPEEISEMRFADIACGSGSFLLGVYDYLLRYQTSYYNAAGKKGEARTAGCLENADGSFTLSIGQRREILRNNVFGVDVDAQATEVAQLSLALKLLEDATTATARAFQPKLGEKILPDMTKNIVCGNSLIDHDILDGQLFERNEERKLNPMSYDDKFPEIMRRGGFDAIVGNPPYVRMEAFKPIKNYLKANFFSHGERSDLYAYFIEKANKLLNQHGKYGVIVSNKFLRANYGKPLREFLEQNATIEQIIDFAGLPVFIGATVRTIVLLTSPKNGEPTTTLYAPPLEIDKFNSLKTGLVSVSDAIAETSYEVSHTALKKEIWSFGNTESEDLIESLKSRFTSLTKYCDGKICRGVVSGLIEAFVIDAQKRAEILEENPEADEIIKPFLNGRDVRRYSVEAKNQFLIYTFHGVNIGKYPAVKKHLAPFKDKLENRATKQAWYELQQPQLKFAPFMNAPKIVFPDISTTTRFAFDAGGHYGSNTTYFIPKNDFYLLALLNSRLGFFYFAQTCAGLEGKGEIYLRFFGQYLEGFPIRQINFADQTEKAAHDKIVALVDSMLEAKTNLQKARTDKDKTFYQDRCNALDRQIDKLVYDLYELTPAEIAVVEGGK